MDKNLKKPKMRPVQEFKFGVYIWKVDNSYVADDEGRALSIASMQHDREKIAALRKAVEHWAGKEVVERGHEVFLPGHRKITDEEYEEQVMRQKLGLTPDPLDVGALRDEALGRKLHG